MNRVDLVLNDTPKFGELRSGHAVDYGGTPCNFGAIDALKTVFVIGLPCTTEYPKM